MHRLYPATFVLTYFVEGGASPLGILDQLLCNVKNQGVWGYHISFNHHLRFTERAPDHRFTQFCSWCKDMSSMQEFDFFLKKKFGRHMSLCGATNAPVLHFWWHLLWVSKPEWAALFILGRSIHDVHFLRFTSRATPADLLVANMATKPFSSTYLQTNIGGAPDWAIPARLNLTYLCPANKVLLNCEYLVSCSILWVTKEPIG